MSLVRLSASRLVRPFDFLLIASNIASLPREAGVGNVGICGKCGGWECDSRNLSLLFYSYLLFHPSLKNEENKIQSKN